MSEKYFRIINISAVPTGETLKIAEQVRQKASEAETLPQKIEKKQQFPSFLKYLPAISIAILLLLGIYHFLTHVTIDLMSDFPPTQKK